MMTYRDSQVADGKECSEGVSFFGVREFIIVDVPTSANEFIQRVGRAVRFNGHAGLPADERVVDVKFFTATADSTADEDAAVSSAEGPAGEPIETADQKQLKYLRDNISSYQQKLEKLQESAFDYGMWDDGEIEPTGELQLEEEEEEEEEEEKGAAGEMAKDKVDVEEMSVSSPHVTRTRSGP